MANVIGTHIGPYNYTPQQTLAGSNPYSQGSWTSSQGGPQTWNQNAQYTDWMVNQGLPTIANRYGQVSFNPNASNTAQPGAAGVLGGGTPQGTAPAGGGSGTAGALPAGTAAAGAAMAPGTTTMAGGPGLAQQPGMGPQIGGQLPFGNSAGQMLSAAASGNPATLGNAYQSAYNDSLRMNSQNYSNILAGYQRTMDSQGQAQQAISAGHQGLQGAVMGDLEGIDASQRQAIKDSYTAQRGTADQDLVNRGLGNMTVRSSVMRGLGLDEAKANIDLSNKLAQTRAGFRSNLGLAGLNYQNQANVQNTALAGRQLDWMNSVNANYPNAGMYSQLASMMGATKGGAPTAQNYDFSRAGRALNPGGYQPAGVASPISGATAPDLSSGGGLSRMGAGSPTSSGSPGSSYRLNGMPVSQQTYQGFQSGQNDMWGNVINSPAGGQAVSAAQGGYGAFTGGGGSALGGLAGGVLGGLREAAYYAKLSPEQQWDYRTYGTGNVAGSSDWGQKVANASLGNVATGGIDSGLGYDDLGNLIVGAPYGGSTNYDSGGNYYTPEEQWDYDTYGGEEYGDMDYFPLGGGVNIGENPYGGGRSSGFVNEGWDTNYGGYGSFGGYDPTMYSYPVGEAGGYGW